MHLAGKRKKAPKGRHTKPNIWDEAAELEVVRGGEKLDPGVNYFVLMLNQMGLDTAFSCEGHPSGFYVTFYGPYQAALEIHSAGFFTVEVERKNYWSLRRSMDAHQPAIENVDALRWAAEAWEKNLGPLDFETAILVAD